MKKQAHAILVPKTRKENTVSEITFIFRLMHLIVQNSEG